MVVEGGWRAEEAIAGNGAALQALRELIIYPFLYAAESSKLGLKWPRGLLLHGPPGTGKTSLVHAVIRECGAHLTAINPHSVQGDEGEGDGEEDIGEEEGDMVDWEDPGEDGEGEEDDGNGGNQHEVDVEEEEHHDVVKERRKRK